MGDVQASDRYPPACTNYGKRRIAFFSKIWANYSKQKFQLHLKEDGNLVLNSINLPTKFTNEPYYVSNTNGESNSSAGMRLVSNKLGYLYILRKNNETFNLTLGEMVSASDYYFRATLGFDGIFTQYHHPKNFIGNVSWNSLWSIPDNICRSLLVGAGIGVCGYNRLCTLKEDQRPTCECPKGYSLLDPNDVYGSCKPCFIQGCEEDKLSSTSDLYDVVELKNACWPTSEYMILTPFTEEMCKQSCLEDCLCAVTIFRERFCWKKKLPRSNGRIDVRRPSTAYLKIRKENSSFINNQVAKNKNHETLIHAGSVLFSCSLFVNLALVGAICLGFFHIYKKKHNKSSKEFVDMNLRYFTYKELEKPTDGFKEELGRGTLELFTRG